MMSKLISVIIPVCNVARYLEQCLDSVVKQSYTNLEIILVDDGSTDESGMICDRYAAIDNRIVVIHKQNGGLSDARNVGIGCATGDYISFIDSDDYVSTLFIETLLKSMQNTGAEIAALKSSVGFWDGDNTEEVLLNENKVVTSEKPELLEDALIQMFYQHIPTGAQFKMYKANIFNDLQFPFGWLYEDVATTYRAFLKAKKIVVVESDVYAYRKRADSIIRQSFNEKKMVCLPIAEQLISEMKPYGTVLHTASISRAYAMVYSVFLQIPNSNMQQRKELWCWLKKHRYQVLFDKNSAARKKNKLGAFASYLGMNMTFFIGNQFGQSIHKR